MYYIWFYFEILFLIMIPWGSHMYMGKGSRQLLPLPPHMGLPQVYGKGVDDSCSLCPTLPMPMSYLHIRLEWAKRPNLALDC